MTTRSTRVPLLARMIVGAALVGLSSDVRFAAASSLLAATAGAPDAATAGSNVAEPLSPLGAQFSNPAGLAGFHDTAMGTGLGLAYGRGVVRSDFGYRAENEVLVPFLDSFLVIPWQRWTFGLSLMGTSGSRYDYGARPSVGIDDGFFSETGMFGLPIGAAFRASDTLWLGAQIVPLYGSSHLRFSREVAEAPGEQTAFRFTTSGFGVQGMLGMTWKPYDGWSVGISVKPPGRVWTDGDTRYGSGKQRVELEVEVPAAVSAGLTRSFNARWSASYSLRFTDSSVLAKSYLRYERTPSANSPYVHGARDEWRHAVGAQYAVSDSVKLLGGFSKANGIVGSKGTNPASYDSKDWRLNSGLRWAGEAWSMDAAFSYFLGGTKRVSADDALVFPGKFESKPAYILSVLITKRF
jgi:long-subunit fatty acid transport protein